jgi:pyruvate dehydrogenase E1 component
MELERWNLLHPGEEPRKTWIETSLEGHDGPVVAATDYMRAFADQIRPWIDAPYRVLGTDGYGRSDYRKTLRSFFEVDRHHVVLAALTELAKTGEVDADAPTKAIESYDIDPERPAPWRV